MSFAGHLAHIVEKRNTWSIRVGKAEGKRPLRRKETTWKTEA
jgi:hypothetical protein